MTVNRRVPNREAAELAGSAETDSAGGISLDPTPLARVLGPTRPQ